MYAYNIHDMYRYTDQLNQQFSNLTIELDVHIGYYTGALKLHKTIYKAKIRQWMSTLHALLVSKSNIWIVNHARNHDYLETRTSVKERI